MKEAMLAKRSKRRKWLGVSLPLFLLLGLVGGLGFGAIALTVPELVGALTNEGDPNHLILLNVRLPRLLVAAIAGACLAAAGAILQGVMKNPLADPSIVGVTAGAGVAASFAMVAMPEYGYLLPPFAFIGAFIAALAIYVLAWEKGASPLRIILAGVAVNALCGAIQSGILILYSDRVQSVLPGWLGDFKDVVGTMLNSYFLMQL